MNMMNIKTTKLSAGYYRIVREDGLVVHARKFRGGWMVVHARKTRGEWMVSDVQDSPFVSRPTLGVIKLDIRLGYGVFSTT